MGENTSFPNVVMSQFSNKSTGFFPSTFSGNPMALMLLHLSLFSKSSRWDACCTIRWELYVWSLCMGAMSSSKESLCPLKQMFVLSLSFCGSCCRNVISDLTPLILAVSAAMEVLQDVTAVKISCNVGSLMASEVAESWGSAKISPWLLVLPKQSRCC